jgi:protein TonB
VTLHVAALTAVLLLAASLRQPEPLFVDLTTGALAGEERPGTPASGSKPSAVPSATPAARTRASANAAPAPVTSARASAAPVLAPARPAETAPAPDRLLPATREVTAPESTGKPSEDGGPSTPAAPDTGTGKGVASDVPSGSGQASAVGSGSRFALAGPGTGRNEVPAEFGPYLASFRQRIQELVVYPLAARRRGLAGRVEVEVILEPSGRVRDVTVAASSSHSLLDEAAIEAVRSLKPVPLPENLPRRPLRVRLPVVFDLR